MKKIYLLLSAIALVGGVNAQTITKAANEPTSGDIQIKKQYDSVGVVPKNTGSGLSWNFSAFTVNTNTAGSTYTTAASVASSSMFAQATLAELTTSGDINFWKSASTPTTQYELHGIYNPAGIEFNFSANPQIFFVWPVAFGANTTDVGSGTVSAFSQTGTVNSTVTAMGSGTGTLTIPGNVTFTNVLQTKHTETLSALVGTFPTSVSINVVSTTYNYFNSTQKFPLVEVIYEKQTQTSAAGPTVSTSAKIYVNSLILTTGINEVNFDADFTMYPNPAKDNISVNLSNSTNNKGSVEIYNELGQVARRVELGNDATIKTTISVADLKPGVYFVKTSLGERTTTKKLIIQ
jgi:hypothetical protein